MNIEETVTDLEGNSTTLMTSKVAIRNKRQEIVGMLAIALDVTEQSNMRQELECLRAGAEAAAADSRQQQRVLRSVLEAIPQFVFWKDRDCVYLGAITNFAQAAGFDNPQDLVGKTDFDMAWKRKEAEFYVKCDREVMDKGEPLLNIEEPQLNADGEETVLLTSKVPLRDTKRRVVGMLGMFADITQRKRAERERDQLQQQLVATSRQAGKAEVATGVLHNVGNALNSVNVGVNLIQENLNQSPVEMLSRLAEALPPQTDELARFVADDPRGGKLPALLAELSQALTADHERIRAEVERLCEQVQHIKEIVSAQQAFSRSGACVEPVAPAQIVADALGIATAGKTLVGIDVRADTPDGLPAIAADKHTVIQILVNLVNNACQAMPGGKGDGVVEGSVSQDADDAWMIFAVTDNGVGMEPQTLAKVFDHGFTTRTAGHGFGLHTARLAAETHHGSLEARSDGLGQGSRFELLLPLTPPKDVDA